MKTRIRSIILLFAIYNISFLISCKQDCSCTCVIKGQPSKSYDLGNVSASYASDKCNSLRYQVNADTCYVFIAK